MSVAARGRARRLRSRGAHPALPPAGRAAHARDRGAVPARPIASGASAGCSRSWACWAPASKEFFLLLLPAVFLARLAKGRVRAALETAAVIAPSLALHVDPADLVDAVPARAGGGVPAVGERIQAWATTQPGSLAFLAALAGRWPRPGHCARRPAPGAGRSRTSRPWRSRPFVNPRTSRRRTCRACTSTPFRRCCP